MNNLLRTLEDYELFLYTLTERFPVVRHSTVTLIRRGSTLARVAGEIYFERDVRLVVRERILTRRYPVILDWYGYEVWQGQQKLFWYDSQPHPDDVTLISTDPHHKHIPPEIKHHRIPAPHMSFTRPNLPVLIQEIEGLLLNSERDE